MPESPVPGTDKALGLQLSSESAKLRFLVAIEFSNKDAAVDNMVDLMTTGWPKGPKLENLKLIVISRELDQGQIMGLEVGTKELKQLDQKIAQLTA